MKNTVKKFHPKPRTSSPTSGVNLVLKMCHKRLHLLKSGVLVAPAIKNKDEDWDNKAFLFENINWHFLLFYKIGFTWWLATKSPYLSQNNIVCHKITLFTLFVNKSPCLSQNHLVAPSSAILSTAPSQAAKASSELMEDAVIIKNKAKNIV